MRVAVVRERREGERRVAFAPESAARFVKAGHEVVVEQHAGEAAGFANAQYEDAGVTLAESAATAVAGADAVLKVQTPMASEMELLTPGSILICLIPSLASTDLIAQLAAREVTALALERVPRITRAQSMDVLSSQATVAGYKAVLLGASALPRLMPMLTTAAGSLTPAKALIIGAGVAGLQAIATARRLGAAVSAFDVRSAAREQVQSLGAAFVAIDVAPPQAESGGGYARTQSDDAAARTQQALARHIKEMDLVISTAAVPGKHAPMLIPESTVRSMRTGSVIVDLAAETGGNCELTQPGQGIVAHGVHVLGPLNLAATMPYHASQMFSRNLLALVQHLNKDSRLTIDLEDEITGPMCVTHKGQVRV